MGDFFEDVSDYREQREAREAAEARRERGPQVVLRPSAAQVLRLNPMVATVLSQC